VIESGRHTIGRWIRDRARATPERVAIDFDGRLVTYRELDAEGHRPTVRTTDA
jgi:fatty-acyl-CoA synthase